MWKVQCQLHVKTGELGEEFGRAVRHSGCSVNYKADCIFAIIVTHAEARRASDWKPCGSATNLGGVKPMGGPSSGVTKAVSTGAIAC
jgi:hypothetical protein